MPDAAPEQIMCATYTHARRHPIVLGKIAGWTPPFQISIPQLGVIVGAFLFEMATWRLWGALLPQTPAIVVAIALPWLLAWAVRRARLEGRSLVRAALGYAVLLSSPPSGRVGGRPHVDARRCDLRGACVRIVADDR